MYRITCTVNCAAIFTLWKAAELYMRFANNPIAPSYNEEAMADGCTLQTKTFGRNS